MKLNHASNLRNGTKFLTNLISITNKKLVRQVLIEKLKNFQAKDIPNQQKIKLVLVTAEHNSYPKES